jgi:hypothetical protein
MKLLCVGSMGFVSILDVYLKFVGPLVNRNLGCGVDALVRLRPLCTNLLD